MNITIKAEMTREIDGLIRNRVQRLEGRSIKTDYDPADLAQLMSKGGMGPFRKGDKIEVSFESDQQPETYRNVNAAS